MRFAEAATFVEHFDLTHRASISSRVMCGVGDCSTILVANLSRLQDHILNFHSTAENNAVTLSDAGDLSIRCPIPNCTYSCKSKSTLRAHRKRKHFEGSETESSVPKVVAAQTDSESVQYIPALLLIFALLMN